MQFCFNGSYYCGMAVPGHQCAKAKVMVDIFVVVDIVDSAALAILHKNWIRLVVSVVAGHSERNTSFRPLVSRCRFRRALLVSCDFVCQCFVQHDESPNQACSAPAKPAPYRSVPCGQYAAMLPTDISWDTRKHSPYEPRPLPLYFLRGRSRSKISARAASAADRVSV